jgi:glycosyltransferase involved in cell wall biosynthesis
MEPTGMAPYVTKPGSSGRIQTYPAVTIVVPCFNGGRFLDGLMASLARQTFRDFEIVIVDDGSTERATLDKLAELQTDARIVRQANRGLSAARNTGIREARAELVLPLDCDDAFESPFLAEAFALMREAPAEVAAVFCHMRLTGAAKGLLERHFNRFDLLFTNTLPSGLLLRKACWAAVGGYDESMRDGYEDWEFHLRLARAGYCAIELPKPYYVYSLADEGMLLNRSSRAHGRLWRAIRRKHADLYRPASLFRLWRMTRDGSGHVSARKAIAALMLAMMLPDALFNRLVAWMRRRSLLDGYRPAYPAETAKTRLAA